MKSIEQLLRAKPAIAKLFSRMNKAGVRWAIFAGSEVALLTGNRAPTDLDIIVHNDDFEALAELLPQAKHTDDEIIPVISSDGEQLEMSPALLFLHSMIPTLTLWRVPGLSQTREHSLLI